MTLKHRWIIIDDYQNVTGTNDSNTARAAFFSGEKLVIDAQDAVVFDEPDESTEGDIKLTPIEDEASE